MFNPIKIPRLRVLKLRVLDFWVEIKNSTQRCEVAKNSKKVGNALDFFQSSHHRSEAVSFCVDGVNRRPEILPPVAVNLFSAASVVRF